MPKYAKIGHIYRSEDYTNETYRNEINTFYDVHSFCSYARRDAYSEAPGE